MSPAEKLFGLMKLGGDQAEVAYETKISISVQEVEK